MSEHKNQLLTGDESKKLHDAYMSPIMAVNECLTKIKMNSVNLLETLDQIITEGGIDKIKGLQKLIIDVKTCLDSDVNYSFGCLTHQSLVDIYDLTGFDLAIINETKQLLNDLGDVLKLVIYSDVLEDASNVLCGLQTGRSKSIIGNFDENGLLRDEDDVTDGDDDNSITLEELLELAGDDGNIITLEELLEAERDHKEVNK